MTNPKTDSGIILLSVLWVVIILSIVTMGLSRLSSGSLAMLNTSLGKARANAAARAGVVYVKDLLLRLRSPKDVLYQCGIDLKDKKSEDLFKGIPVGDRTHFDIVYEPSGYSVLALGDKVYGIEDEERRLNLNALDQGNAGVLTLLLSQVGGVEIEQAEKITSAVVDWKDAISHDLRVPAKNKAFENIDELLLIQGITPDVFGKIRGYLTVYPKEGSFKVNLSTASTPLLKAMTGWLKQQDSVADEIIRRRDGKDALSFTEDDGGLSSGAFVSVDLGANALSNFDTGSVSRYFRVRSVGVDEDTGVRSVIVAVLDVLETGKGVRIVSWRRE